MIEEARQISRKVKKLLTVKAITTVESKGGDYEQEGPWRCQAWDDVTGEELDEKEVMRARRKEIGYIEEKKVWKK